jgi:hypothetical protein
MASEDSDQVLSRLAVIHRLRELRNLDQAGHREMPAGRTDLDAARKALEVVPLRGAQRVIPKERDHDFQQLVPSADDEAMQVLLVVVVTPIDRHATDSKEIPQLREGTQAARALHYYEAVGHLVSGSIAPSVRPIGLLDEADGEASFAINETGYPADPDQPFLLIFRTARIVTAHSHQARASTGRILGFSSI